jgi:Flp pilus assembly protein TadG
MKGKKIRLTEDGFMGQRLTFIRNNKGAAMAELAITLPILLVVLFGIFEFGLVMYNKAVITNASREGARAGIVFRADANTGAYDPYTEPEIQAVVNTYLDNGKRLIPPTAYSIDVLNDVICTEGNPRPPITVQVAYDYNFFILPNFVTSLIGPIHLVGETIMRCE